MGLFDVFDSIMAREFVLERGWQPKNAQLFEPYHRLIIEQVLCYFILRSSLPWLPLIAVRASFSLLLCALSAPFTAENRRS